MRQLPLAPEMLQLQHYEKGMGYGPFDKDTATTMEGYFKTFKQHLYGNKSGEHLTDETISVVCETLSTFPTTLGGGKAPPPRAAYADFAHDDRVKVRDHVLQAVKKYGSSNHPDVVRDIRTKWRFTLDEARAALAEATSEGQGVDSPQLTATETASGAYFTHSGAEGTKASVLEEFQHMWAKGLLCHARSVYFSMHLFTLESPPIVKCLTYTHVASPLRLRS